MHDRELEELMAGVPRKRLGLWPTPLQDCPNLNRSLGEVRVLVKRDDLTGIGFGGNKTRALEFIVGDALQRESDTLITWGLASAPANHCRLTAAAAARADMGCIIVLGGSGFDPSLANTFLSRLLGAELRFVSAVETAELRAACRRLMDELRSGGRRPYLVDAQYCFYGGFATLGYTDGVLELRRQLQALGVAPNYIYTCSEGGTQAGLVLGKRLLDARFDVVGIAPRRLGPSRTRDIARWAEAGARLLGLELEIAEAEITNYDDFAGEGGRTVSAHCVETIELLARTEGIILDPIYSGKAMAGLVTHVRSGKIKAGETVVFVHTGGTPVLFDHVDNAGRIRSLAGRGGYV
jgi:1-aminocyclopropane-1-carboxylate deaminase/D-cysteine desulfhydrase-like pyridoxal-dependent ACC family enzyme